MSKRKAPDATAAYVERHMWPELSSANQANMIYLGRMDTVGRGRVHATYATLAEARGRSPKTIEHQIRGIIAARRFLYREGWTFVIIGADEHDEAQCGHGACIAATLAGAQLARRLNASDELAALRRKKDAERKRLARAAKRAAEGF